MSEQRAPTPDLAGQLRVLPQYNSLGATRPFGPGEFVKNSDGSWSNEYSVTVEDPRQAGRFMVVPSLWLQNGKPTLLSEDQAAETAANSSLSFPTFGSEKKAEAYADIREGHWQQVPEGRSDLLSPLWTHNPAPHPDTDTSGMSEDRFEKLSPEEVARGRTATVTQADRFERVPPPGSEPIFGSGRDRWQYEGREGPPQRPLSEAGPAMLRGFGGDFIGTAAGQLGRGIADLPAYGTNVIGNFFRGILEPRAAGGRGAVSVSEPQREARGEFEGQVGDIGTAVTGGLQNPLSPALRAGAAARRGALVPDPRVAQVPPPRAALAPPIRGVPGEAAVSTGGGMIPPGPGSQMTAPSATPGAPVGQVGPPFQPPPAPQGPGLQVQLPGQRPGQLALPPPTIGVPAGPGITTGPGRPAAPGGAIPFTPPPGRGLVPGSQPGTMRTQQPGAPSPISPGISFTGRPLPTAAEVAGAAAGRDLPPRAPGTGGRPGGPRATSPVEPLVPHGAEQGKPSSFVSAFFQNNPEPIDRALTRGMRRLTHPGMPDPPSGPGLDAQNRNMMTAVDTIIENKNNIQFTDANNNLLSAGRKPQSLDQFVQSIDYLKGRIFDDYDTLARQVSGRGVQVDLAPTVARLRELAAQPELRDVNPAVAQQALDMADRFEQARAYSPKEMQNVIQSAYQQTKGIKTQETFSRNSMLNDVVGTMRESLNQTMETALQGPQYQGLRNRYGALASIEKDVANGLRNESSRVPGGLFERLARPVQWVNAIHGLFSLDPHSLGFAAAIQGARKLDQYLHGPNRAVTRLFNARERVTTPTMTERASAVLGSNLGELRQRQFDRTFAPYVGTAGP
jgi:hypothetical protein